MKSGFIVMAAVAGIVATPVLAQNSMPVSGTYEFDPEHSSISFSYQHNNGIAESYGLVREIQGSIVLDTENLSNSSVEASFPLSNLMTVAPALDEHLRSDDFFSSPDGSSMISFTSTEVIPDGDHEADVKGDLTINGITRPVTLEAEFNSYGEGVPTGRMTVGFDGETTIKRTDFDLGMFAPVVADEVEVKISVEAMAAE